MGNRFSVLLGLTLGWLAALPCAAQDELVLVANGKSDYEIVVAANSVEGTKMAAHELQSLIQKSTGVELPIEMSPSRKRKQIFVGTSFAATDRGVTDKDLVLDGYHLRIAEGTVYLVGRDDARLPFLTLNNNQSASAGSYYAMLDFARRFLGARWYMPGPLGEEVARLDALKVPATLDIAGAPRYTERSIDIVSKRTKETEDALRKNGSQVGTYFDEAVAEQAYRWGRHLRLGNNFDLNVEHSWFQWMPAEEPSRQSSEFFGKSHPEYYAVPGGTGGKYYTGRDNTAGGHLCMCNPEVAKVMADNIIKYAKRTRIRNFSLSQNDGSFSCTCDCCKAHPERFQPETPELTAEFLKFSNNVVDRVVKEVPDARFGIYAYGWALQPPADVKARPQIDMSDVYNGLPYVYYLPAERKKVEAQLAGWRNSVESIVLTSYYLLLGHYSLPWATPEVHTWLFEQLGSHRSSTGLRLSYDLQDLAPVGLLGADPWVAGEVLWGTDKSVEQLNGEYYKGAFGAAAGAAIREYFKTIEASMAQATQRVPYRGAPGVKNYILPAYQPIRERCGKLIQQAEAAVADSDERYRWRVDRVARGWRYTEMTLDMMLADQRGERAQARALAERRRAYMADPENRFALAPASSDNFEVAVPLISNRSF